MLILDRFHTDLQQYPDISHIFGRLVGNNRCSVLPVRESRDLATRWIRTCDIIYNARGKFVEKYNVVEPENLSKGGEYDVQDGFGWSNGVYIAMLEYLKK